MITFYMPFLMFYALEIVYEDNVVNKNVVITFRLLTFPKTTHNGLSLIRDQSINMILISS